MVMCRFGGYREGDTHDPIPNSTVKPLRAYDTMTQVMGKSVAAKSTHYHTLFYFLSCLLCDFLFSSPLKSLLTFSSYFFFTIIYKKKF